MPIDCTSVIKADMSACGQSLAKDEEKEPRISQTTMGQDRIRAIKTASRPLYHGAT